jgi:2-polyprenyl-3-methyl-5-hydroxy-6-metoxy-1,4-benzoquinol methylase
MSRSSAGIDAAGRGSSMSVSGVIRKRRAATFPTPKLAWLLDGSTKAPAPVRGGGSDLTADAKVANVVEVRMEGTWAAKCLGLAEGDEVTITRFTVTRVDMLPKDSFGVEEGQCTTEEAPLIALDDYSDVRAIAGRGSLRPSQATSPFVLEPNSTTTIAAKKTVQMVIGAGENDDDPNDITRRGATLVRANPAASADMTTAHAAQGQLGPPAPSGNLYPTLGRYYDGIHAQKAAFSQHAAFIERIIGSRRGAILDVGCGTGALAHHLAIAGYPVLAVDPSPAMAAVMAEKAASFNSHGAAVASVRFVQAAPDAADFALLSVAESGMDSVHRFNTILCIDTLSHLPSVNAVRKAIAAITLHAGPGCLFIVSLLNLDWWGPRIGSVTQEANHFELDRRHLAVTAASIQPGVMDTIARTYVGSPTNGDDGAEVVTDLTALVLHPRSEKPTLQLHERVVERCIAPSFFESLVENLGWRIRDVYAGLDGNTFAVGAAGATSAKRVYVLQREDTS